MEKISIWAEQLYIAQQHKQPCPPINVEVNQTDNPLEAAYQIQQFNVQRKIRAGGRIIGRKIGLTSKAVQQQLGVDSPDFGVLFADMAYGDGELIPSNQFIQPKVEAEIALVLKEDLDKVKHSFVDIINATDYALAAIEIVDSRIENWKISLIDTVADNASSAAFVLGSKPVQLKDIDLANCKMSMSRKGELVSEGVGKSCLANPLNAAVWLADEMVRRGNPMKKGDIVLTGALGPMVAVHPGDEFQVEIEGFGSVTAAFAE